MSLAKLMKANGDLKAKIHGHEPAERGSLDGGMLSADPSKGLAVIKFSH
jgi:hypothetical protein